MAANLSLLLVVALLPLAACLTVETDASALQRDAASEFVPPKKAMVATVLEHTQQAPVDMMLSHQLRMLSPQRHNLADVAVINMRVPDVDSSQGTVHDPVVSQMARSYGTTGSVKVVDLEADQTRQMELLRKVFSVRQGSSVVFAKKFFQQSLTSDTMKRQMAYFTAMLQFVDLCSQAEYGVELCINMEGQSLLHRTEKKGLVELASELFDEDEEVLGLQPPSFCQYTQAHRRPTWAKKDKWTNSSFTKCVANATKAMPELGPENMIFNRQRLMAVLPLSVDDTDLDLGKGFDYAFMKGLKGAGAIKGMQCGHAFLIRPSGQEAKCKGKMVPFQQQARTAAAAQVKSFAAYRLQQRQELDDVAGEYELFDQMVVKGVQVLVDRMETGMLPPVTGTVGERCLAMCPSKDRVKEGLAW